MGRSVRSLGRSVRSMKLSSVWTRLSEHDWGTSFFRKACHKVVDPISNKLKPPKEPVETEEQRAEREARAKVIAERMWAERISQARKYAATNHQVFAALINANWQAAENQREREIAQRRKKFMWVNRVRERQQQQQQYAMQYHGTSPSGSDAFLQGLWEMCKVIGTGIFLLLMLFIVLPTLLDMFGNPFARKNDVVVVYDRR